MRRVSFVAGLVIFVLMGRLLGFSLAWAEREGLVPGRSRVPLSVGSQRTQQVFDVQAPIKLQKERPLSTDGPTQPIQLKGNPQQKDPVFFELPPQDNTTAKQLDKDIDDVKRGIGSLEFMLRRLTVKEFYVDRATFYDNRAKKAGKPIDQNTLSHWDKKDVQDLLVRITGNRFIKVDDATVTLKVGEFKRKLKAEVAGLVINAGGLISLIGNNAAQLVAGKALEEFFKFKILDSLKDGEKTVKTKIEDKFQKLKYKEKKELLNKLIDKLKDEKTRLEKEKKAGTANFPSQS